MNSYLLELLLFESSYLKAHRQYCFVPINDQSTYSSHQSTYILRVNLNLLDFFYWTK